MILDRFYPIVPSAAWVARIVPLGVKLVQLRMKDIPPERIAPEIAAALAITLSHGATLVVNDYWREAIQCSAPFVHLGQEDLATADVGAIHRAGVQLGISTHSEAELETALMADPDYVALGPIYETRLKAMPWAPQGLERVRQWKRRIGALPLVAIGGLTPDRAPGVIEAGASSVAVITDFMTAADPDARIKQWIAWARAE